MRLKPGRPLVDSVRVENGEPPGQAGFPLPKGEIRAFS